MKFTLLILLLVSSCSSIQSVNKPFQYQKSVCIQSTEQDVWNWLHTFMKTNDLEIIESDQEKLYMVGYRGMGWWTWGEYFGVQLSKNNQNIKASYKFAKRMKLNITATNWENEFAEQVLKKYSNALVPCK